MHRIRTAKVPKVGERLNIIYYFEEILFYSVSLVCLIFKAVQDVKWILFYCG